MRILGFSKKWDKLSQPEFTTFRYPRADKDWYLGEVVQVVFKPRSKERGMLGVAEIVGKERRAMAWHGDKTSCPKITNIEAIEDGFSGTEEKAAYFNMFEFLWDYYGGERLLNEPINKLTLRWIKRE